MRILAIEHEVTLLRGGSERSYFDVLTGLQQAGHEVYLLYHTGGNLVDAYSKEGVQLFQREHSLLMRKGTKWNDFRELWKSATYIINQVKPDVIYANFTEALPLAALVHWRSRIPVVCHIRIGFFGLTRQILLGAKVVSKFIVINQKLKPIFEKALRAEGKVDVVYNGIAIPSVLPAAKTGAVSTLKILYLGRIARDKGVVDLVEALGKVLRQGVKAELQLTGGYISSYLGDFKAELKEVIENEGLARFITISAPIPNPIEYIAQFDLFVFPSTTEEGFGRTVVESIIAGVPVIARDVGMVSEMMAQNPAFVYSKTEELAQKILDFAQGKLNFDLNSARERVIRDFNKDRMIAEVEQKLYAVVPKKDKL